MRGGWEAVMALIQHKPQRDRVLTAGDWAIVGFILAVVFGPVVWKALS